MPTLSTHGPIADKFIADTRKVVKQKVVDIETLRTVKEQVAYFDKLNENVDLSHLDSLHAIFVAVQHQLADFITLFTSTDIATPFADAFEKAEAIYMPSWPPMSPVSTSYFTMWSGLDMSIGKAKETFATMMLDYYRHFIPEAMAIVPFLEVMQTSYTGFYWFVREEEKGIILREVYTGKEVKAIVPSNHKGRAGELWYTRLFFSPFDGTHNYGVCFTSPYVILNVHQQGTRARIEPYQPKVWDAFIERNLFKTGLSDKKTAYYQFLKYGLDKHYWPEYVFVAYLNYTGNAIFLTGIPDVSATLPHHSDNDTDDYDDSPAPVTIGPSKKLQKQNKQKQKMVKLSRKKNRK